MSQPNFNQDIELLKISVLLDERRSRYLTALGLYVSLLIGFFTLLITRFEWFTTPVLYPNVVTLVAIVGVGIYVAREAERLILHYRHQFSRINALIKTVQAGNTIPDIDELVKSTWTDEKSGVEGKSRPETPQELESPTTTKRDMEPEKLRLAWDYRKSIELSLLVLVFSGSLAIATISNTLLVTHAVNPHSLLRSESAKWTSKACHSSRLPDIRTRTR
jgi:hypothetical protein